MPDDAADAPGTREQEVRRVVLLHGHAGSPARLDDLRASLLAELGPGASVDAPAGACALADGSFAWWDDAGPIIDAKEAVRELRMRADLRGALVIGFSQGGALAVTTALLGAGVAGAVCIGGFLPDGIDVRHAVSPAPVLLLHGSNDDVVDLLHAERSANSLRAAGHDVTLDEGVGGHEIPDDAAHTVAMWLLRS